MSTKGMQMSEETVLVLVTARQLVSYKQRLTFTKDDWERFKALDDREAGDEITDRLDLRNVYDGEQIEQFGAIVVAKDGKPISPKDERECW